MTPTAQPRLRRVQEERSQECEPANFPPWPSRHAQRYSQQQDKKGKDESLSTAIKNLDSQDAAQQVKAIDQVGHRGPAAAAAVPKLLGLLSAKSDEVRWHAARALAAMGPKAAEAVPHLAKSLG